MQEFAQVDGRDRSSATAAAATTYVALLRAVNVGGTGKLAMPELRRLVVAAGGRAPRTYIASGNVVFEAQGPEARIRNALERELGAHTGRAATVLVRSAAEMQAVLAANPFPQAAANRVVAIFLDAPPAPQALATLRHQRDEQLALGRREIYVHYGSGMASSKLVIPAAQAGTARNLNTVAALARMAQATRAG
jgi:uncharacterized protein (DUF1697 family)